MIPQQNGASHGGSGYAYNQGASAQKEHGTKETFGTKESYGYSSENSQAQGSGHEAHGSQYNQGSGSSGYTQGAYGGGHGGAIHGGSFLRALKNDADVKIIFALKLHPWW